MRRKIVRQGTSTLTISLPSSWTKRFALEGGEELDIEDKGNELIISCEKQPNGPHITLDVSDVQRLMNRSILNAYQLGYDTVVVQCKDTGYDPTSIVNELFGFEIVQQTASSYLLKDIIGTTPKEFENLLRRLFLLVKTMISDGTVAVKDQNYEELKQLFKKDIEINKLSHVCLRYIAKQGYVEDIKRSYSMFVIIHRLEEIADQFKHLYKRVAEHHLSMSPECFNLLSSVSKLFDTCYQYTYQLKAHQALDIAAQFDDAQQSIAELMKQSSENQTILLQMSNIVTNMLTIQGIQLGFLGKEEKE